TQYRLPGRADAGEQFLISDGSEHVSKLRFQSLDAGVGLRLLVLERFCKASSAAAQKADGQAPFRLQIVSEAADAGRKGHQRTQVLRLAACDLLLMDADAGEDK